MNKIGLIGAFLNDDLNSLGGETLKNQILKEALERNLIEVKVLNTFGWDTHKLFFSIKLFLYLIKMRKLPIILSTGSRGALKLLKILYKLRYFGFFNLNLYYLVIGGYLPMKLRENQNLIKYLSLPKKIYVETKGIKKMLEELGISNVYVLPNFKEIKFQPSNFEISENGLKIVYLSRVSKDKGIEEAIKAISVLSEKYNVKLEIYGPIEWDYKNCFYNILKNKENVEYKGVLNPKSNNFYQVLSKYDLMIFPTAWSYEGFPGVVIDSYIAGVPVLASDWEYSSEIIKEYETGFIVKRSDFMELKNKIEWIINNKYILRGMRVKCLEEAKKYDVMRVIKILLEDLNFKVS